MNSWEAYALQYNYPDDQSQASSSWQPASSSSDPIIYPGLYAPSGFDIMSILVQVSSRPNPKFDLGPIDASCALILCDMEQADSPIVYATDPFYDLTGYSPDEVIGQNCRFLQAPGGKVRKGGSRKHVDKDVLRKLRKAVEKNAEVQVEITNFKKDGSRFTNLLTMIPVCQDGSHNYFVGLQCDKDEF